jgi:septal ring factor EnvC (AmiA/AmiB activator)
VTDDSQRIDDLVAEISRLEHEAAALSRARKKLHDQIDRGFGNEAKLRQERQVSDKRQELHRRIDVLRAQLETARGDR